MKKLIPTSSRVKLRVCYAYVASALDGTYFRFTSPRNGSKREGKKLKPQISITQPIRKTSYSANKVHNLKVASKRIQNIVINPGEIFSFWHMVGVPNSQRDFRVGRTIIGTELNTSIGGGLCQLAGIIYHLGLLAGWEVLERHAHSLDLYNEKTRFTPLGADASVAYGYKDLRIRNTCGVATSIRLEITGTEIKASLCASREIPTCDLEFKERRKEGYIYVKTLRFHPPAWKEDMGVSTYKTYEVEELPEAFAPEIPEKSPLSIRIEQEALRDWTRSEILSR